MSMIKDRFHYMWIAMLVFGLLAAPAAGGFRAAEAGDIPTFEAPAIAVSPGLAPEIQMFRIIAKRVKLDCTTNAYADIKDLTRDGKALYKSIIFIIGSSGKGLGAAGVDIEGEMEKAKRLIAKGKELGMKLIGIHTGGASRRGPNTEKMILIIVPNMNGVVVRKDGNQDGMFTKLTSESKVPLVEIEKTQELLKVLKQIYKLP